MRRMNTQSSLRQLPRTVSSAKARQLGAPHAPQSSPGSSASTLSLSIIISMAREGKLTRYLDAKSLTTLLGEFYGVGESSHRSGLLKRREVPHEK